MVVVVAVVERQGEEMKVDRWVDGAALPSRIALERRSHSAVHGAGSRHQPLSEVIDVEV